MNRLLHIKASPRPESQSAMIAETYIAGLVAKDPSLEVDVLDLWAEDIPAFDGDKAAAKMTFFGVGELDGPLQTAWDQVVTAVARFTAADHYVVSSPMWNGGIPYRLKQYIDLITQPGLLFGFDPDRGYFGLLEGKTARLALTSGVWAPGVPEGFGTDFQERYLDWWFRLAGVSDVATLAFRPSMMQADPGAAFAQVLRDAGQSD